MTAAPVPLTQEPTEGPGTSGPAGPRRSGRGTRALGPLLALPGMVWLA